MPRGKNQWMYIGENCTLYREKACNNDDDINDDDGNDDVDDNDE